MTNIIHYLFTKDNKSPLQGRYNEAEIHFQKFLKDSPDKVKGHLELAQLYDRLGNRDKAKKERQKADLS